MSRTILLINECVHLADLDLIHCEGNERHFNQG